MNLVAEHQRQEATMSHLFPQPSLNASGWSEWKETAFLNGIDYALYYERVHKLNKSPAEAATMPRERRPVGTLIDGIWDYKKAHCERIGVSYQTVKWYMRVNRVPFEEAFSFYAARQNVARAS